MKKLTGVVVFLAISLQAKSQETIDSAVVAGIKDEGFNRSGVMAFHSSLVDRFGPRLTWSPTYRRAAEWARDHLDSMGLGGAHLESWSPLGRGWELRRFTSHLLEPQAMPLISYPKAWSSPTRGTVRGDALYLDAESDSALDLYRGRLKGKFVLLGKPREMRSPFEPLAYRETDSSLLALANRGPSKPRSRNFASSPAQKARALLEYRKIDMCRREGALALLTGSRGDGGTIFVQSATLNSHPDTPWTRQPRIFAADAPDGLPQIAVAAEHYNRMVRLLQQNVQVRLEMNLDVSITKPDSGYNVVAEIPGGDLRNEIVMIGGHLDCWHGGTGATDDGAGVAACVEAMRILRRLGVQPRRTIRIGLWGGEEQGLFGSRAYVRQHFRRDTSRVRGGDEGPAGSDEILCAYFNVDNGTGRIRGVFMQENEEVRPIFRAWLEPFKEMNASTLTYASTRGSDHMAFDEQGLPGFQFIQDDIEYFTRTWHSTMDVHERIVPDDLMQISTVLAVFAYHAAMRDDPIPRKSPSTVKVDRTEE